MTTSVSGQWLSLLNYSAKYNISLSTLRRRIKNDTIHYRLDGGKYFIMDDGGEAQFEKPEPKLDIAFQTPAILAQTNFVESSALNSANKLVEELKVAYAKILQEKEEQIGLLKDEVVDLRMLVRVLEDQLRKKEDAEKKPQPIQAGNFLFGDIDLKDI